MGSDNGMCPVCAQHQYNDTHHCMDPRRISVPLCGKNNIPMSFLGWHLFLCECSKSHDVRNFHLCQECEMVMKAQGAV